jgi:acetolactate synthase-1/2/3 large subunit
MTDQELQDRPIEATSPASADGDVDGAAPDAPEPTVAEATEAAPAPDGSEPTGAEVTEADADAETAPAAVEPAATDADATEPGEAETAPEVVESAAAVEAAVSAEPAWVETAPEAVEPAATDADATEPGEAETAPEVVEPAAAVEAAVSAGPADAEAAPAPMAPPTISAGRFVADALRSAGVKFAFTVPGESFLGLLDALGDAGIKVVATRHEAAAAFMAEAYGQLTGRPAACLGTRAVGAANMSIGIHTARQDSSPVFAIVGQVGRERRGREAFQEVDQVESFGRLAKWAVEVDRVGALAESMEEAVRRALSGRPGPVLISLPEDLLDEPMTPGPSPIARRMTAPPPDAEEVRAVIHLLTDAERPIIVAGGGVLRARATSDLVRLAEILEIPVVAGWRRPDAFPNDHRLYLGMTGYGAAPTVRARLLDADAVLVIGSRLNEITTFGYSIPTPTARWAQVDLEPRRAHAGLSASGIAITSDARTFLRAARERLAGAVHDARSFDERRARNEADRAAYESASIVDATPWDGPGVHPGRVVVTLRDVLPAEAIITTDAGNFGQWAARGFRFRRPGTFIGPTSGAMGYGLPAAITASLVHRDRPVVALTGDGGFAMTMAELETAVRERLRPIVLVFDNGRFGTIRAQQVQRGTGVGVATELGSIDFAAIAEACGARGVHVASDDAFEPALREALASDRATVIHLALDPAWVSVDEPAVV